MSNKWFKLLLAGIVVLVVVVLVNSDIKIPDSGLVASIIDTITDIIPTEQAPADSIPTELIPIDSTSTEIAAADSTSTESISISSTSTEPAPTESTSTTDFQDILQIFSPLLPFENPIFTPTVPPAPPTVSQGIHNLKVFIQDQETLESAINDWFTTQKNIAVEKRTTPRVLRLKATKMVNSLL